MDYKKIVWLSSFPKSGNTWLRCFLDAYLLGSVDINQILCSMGDDVAAGACPGDGSDPSTYPVDVQILTRPMMLLRMVRRFNSVEHADVPLFVKTHNAHMNANGIEMLPLALTKAVIHIVRDPRDVILSYAKHIGRTVDETMEIFFDKYRVLNDARTPKLADFVSSWPAHVASYANSDSHNVLIFRYEDMKIHPLRAFKLILQHAGVAFDEARCQAALDMVRLENLKKQEAEQGFRESSPYAKNQFFGDGATGGWRNVLTPFQRKTIEKNCAAMMKRFGYLTEGVKYNGARPCQPTPPNRSLQQH